MQNTKIQWADTTVNPVMGCDGCELWPSAEKARDAIVSAIGQLGQWQNSENMGTVISRVIGRRRLSEICQDQENIAAQIAGGSGVGDNRGMRAAVIDTVRAMAKCYAGIFTAKRGASNPGFPKTFEEPQLFQGRVAKAAGFDNLHSQKRSEKPWMDFLPRLIFISDMGDALSTNIQFPDLKREIIDPVVSAAGQRH
jgi:hypothetical protein